MTNKIIMSIHAEHSHNIFELKKDLELRKTAPKGGYPFIVYLYETKNSTYKGSGGVLFPGAGAVVGFFSCKAVVKTSAFGSALLKGCSAEEDAVRALIAKRACLAAEKIAAYANGGDIIGLEVSTPTRFPRPRPLSEFGLTRPPQSWQYLK